MQKRGQVTLFLIMGLVVLIAAAIFFYISKSNVQSKVGVSADKNSRISEASIVKAYAESCIKKAAEDGLFERMGNQGGYINPVKQDEYGEDGIKNSLFSPDDSSLFQGKKIPYYLQATCNSCCYNWVCTCNTPGCTPSPISNPNCGPNPPANSCPNAVTCVNPKCKWSVQYFKPDITPDLNILSGKLSKYVQTEFKKCFDEDTFKGIGIQVIKTDLEPSVKAEFNSEDTSITLNQKMDVIAKDSNTKIETFRVDIPIRFKTLYADSLSLVDKIKTKITDFPEIPDSVIKYPYSIGLDCLAYTNKINVFSWPSDSDSKSRIAQFVDSKTYDEHYKKSYIFQFAMKNINITDSCALP